MATDIKKMREKLAKLHDKSGGKGKTVNYWKPAESDTTIRILPAEDGDPLKEFFFHYLKGDDKKTQSIFCPKKNVGESCPICDLVSKLYKEGDEESRKMAKDLSSKQRFFSTVVVRGEEEKGVHVWGYSKTVYEALLKLIVNPEYGDITDINDGLDLMVSSSKKAGQMYPDTSVTAKRKSSPLAAKKETIDDLMNHGLDFDVIFEKKTTGQVAEALDVYLKGGNDEGGDVSHEAASDEAVDLDAALKHLGV